MLAYFRPLTYDDYTLSIDNVVTDYYFHPKQREDFMKLLHGVALEYCCEVTHWQSFKIGTYKEQFTVDLQDGNSFWLGLGLNEGKTNYGKVRIDFNPNKVAHHDCFRKVLAFLNSCSRPLHKQMRRYDLAIDFPVLRENAFLVKDNRLYSEVRYSDQDRTQYLGKKNTPNYVKLYNKQIESSLSSPLTRLELTLDPAQLFEDVHFPEVYFIRDLKLTFDELKINETDRFILGALLQGYGEVSQLGRKTRAKMEALLEGYTNYFMLPREHFNKIHDQLRDFLEYPARPLDARNLDTDFLEPYKAFDPNDYEDMEDFY